MPRRNHSTSKLWKSAKRCSDRTTLPLRQVSTTWRVSTAPWALTRRPNCSTSKLWKSTKRRSDRTTPTLPKVSITWRSFIDSWAIMPRRNHSTSKLWKSTKRCRKLFQQALETRKKELGPEHPDTANSLNNLAELYQLMGDYAKAEPIYQQALQIRKK